ncbi:MAG: glucose-1-phosphate thymidylyltransferase RfbA [Oscillospiraceae bacterium]|nr:glucose-1-phosphate thymidylyltransferase RfbA [Oscillospiraceae bacterium]
MKGMIMAGGTGTRLYPLTMAVNKQLLPVYDKPMVYYPLSTLMLAGIREILILSTPSDLPRFEQLLGDGSRFGTRLEYIEQPSPDGEVQAFLLGEGFIGDEPCALILGDNFFYGAGMQKAMKNAADKADAGRATLFCHWVKNPERFGTAEFDEDGRVTSIEEKPEHPRSNYCITGLYFYPKGVSRLARKVQRSPRGMLELPTLNTMYMELGLIDAEVLERDITWMDTGLVDTLADAAAFVRSTQAETGRRIAAPEEIAYRKGWISKDSLLEAAEQYGKTEYGQYLKKIAEN